MLKKFASAQRASVSLLLTGLMIAHGIAVADEIDDAEDVPATAEEVRFIDAITTAVNEAVPAIDGWHREVSVHASGNKVREGKPTLIYERAREFPLKVSVQVNYREITETDRKQAAEQKTAEQLQQEMMTAAMSGDQAKMNQLQAELAAMMQASMEAGAMGQAAGKTPMQPKEDPKKFQVQVIVNGEGESIGKKFDYDAPLATKAFRVDNGNPDLLSYKYYLGGWEVSELDRVNWRVVDPADAQTAENHLRAVVVSVNVYGDRGNVEDFVSNRLDIGRINELVD